MAEILIKTQLLNTYLNEQAVHIYRPGISDCAMLCLNWLETLTQDTGFKDRYHYQTEDAGKAFGSLKTLAEEAAAYYGLKKTTSPQAGDVAVLDAGGFGHICAIRTASGKWAFRAKEGVNLYRLKAAVISCWRV